MAEPGGRVCNKNIDTTKISVASTNISANEFHSVSIMLWPVHVYNTYVRSFGYHGNA